MSRLAWGVWVEIIILYAHFGLLSVTPRMRRVSWNVYGLKIYLNYMSRLAWGVWVEIYNWWISGNRSRSHASHEACELKFPNCKTLTFGKVVTPRMRRVSWNDFVIVCLVPFWFVTPRMRRVSWNHLSELLYNQLSVTPRMRRVSWNIPGTPVLWCISLSRLAWGVWVEISWRR